MAPFMHCPGGEGEDSTAESQVHWVRSKDGTEGTPGREPCVCPPRVRPGDLEGVSRVVYPISPPLVPEVGDRSGMCSHGGFFPLSYTIHFWVTLVKSHPCQSGQSRSVISGCY